MAPTSAFRQAIDLRSSKNVTVREEETGENLEDIVYIVSGNLNLDLLFDSGYGLAKGKPFTAWTKKRVYFPCVYDGAEWVGTVPRNPCDEITEHIGCQ